MPNGDRLRFVPGGGLNDYAADVDMRTPTLAQPCKKKAKLAHNPDVDLNVLCWDSVSAVVRDPVLRGKLNRFLRKAWPYALGNAKSASAVLKGWDYGGQFCELKDGSSTALKGNCLVQIAQL